MAEICPNDGAYLYDREDGGQYCVYPGCNHDVAPPSALIPVQQPPRPPAPATPPIPRSKLAPSATVSVAIPPVPPPVSPPIPTPSQPIDSTSIGQGTRTGRILITVVSIAIIGIGTFLIYNSRRFSVRIDKALADGRIFAPPGENVVDLWTAEHARNPGSVDLTAAAARIKATLAPKGEDAFVRWHRDSDEKVDWDEQARLYALLTRLDPSDTTFKIRSLYAAGQKEYRATNYAGAVAAYQRAIELDACYVLALNGVGKVYARRDSPFLDLPTAVQYYEKAVRCDATFTWAHFNLGSHYMSQAQWKNAERHMAQALRASPRRASILRALGRINYNLGKYSAALNYYRESLRTESDPAEIARAHRSIEQIQQKLH